MPIRLAIVVSHPIQYFAPWHRELARLSDVELKVFFCCDWGLNGYVDPQFKTEVKWDIPLVEGYAHEFLPIARRPKRLGFWQVDNPTVGESLDLFRPDVVKIFGYGLRTTWRAARWAHTNHRPVLLYSDSNVQVVPSWWKRPIKDFVVGRFYGTYVDGAFAIGRNNHNYHARYGLPPERIFRGLLPIDRLRLLESGQKAGTAREKVRAKFGIPSDGFVVMFCGKYQPHKRPLDLVMAVHALARKGLSVWCVLVGDGPEREAIVRFCSREQVLNAVLTGFVNQSEIGSFYMAADVLAVTSSLDAYGLVVPEASTFGLPIIISDRVGCIGPNDSAQPGRNAIVYPCGDIPALARAIERLYHDRDLRNRMGHESYRIAQSQDVDSAAQQLARAVQCVYELGPRKSTTSKQSLPRSEVAQV